MKYLYNECSRCGGVKKETTSSICPTCLYNKNGNMKKIEENRERITEFVNRIEKRNGMASIKEVYVELITLYSKVSGMSRIDKLEPNKQLEEMYRTLKRIYRPDL